MATQRKTSTTSKTKDAAPSKFEQFRDRAMSVGVTVQDMVTNDPYVLGEEEGFDPPIELPRPALRARMIAEDALRKGDALTVSQIVFGPHADRILARLEQYERETGDNANAVLMGLFYDYFSHFYGEGAASESFPNVSN